jgi:hypothetical protein
MQPLIQVGIRNVSAQYNSHLDASLASQYLGYNTFVGNTEYFSSTLYYKKLDDKINEIRKSIATSDANQIDSYFSQIKSKPTKSAFDNIPNVSDLSMNQNNNSCSKTLPVSDENDTVESTHTGSNDALPPKFHVDVYGTRKEPIVTRVIYDKNKIEQLNKVVKMPTDVNVQTSRPSIAWDVGVDEPIANDNLTRSHEESRISRETQTSLIVSPKPEVIKILSWPNQALISKFGII